MHFRSKKLLALARDRPCVLCGSKGTTVAAHANSVALGKGRGIKAPDCCIAYVCQEHHDQIDGKATLNSAYATPFEMWQWAHTKTVLLWFSEGIVEVT